MPVQTLSQVITQAVADIEKNGYDSQERVNHWIKTILAVSNQYTDKDIMDYLKRSLGSKYTRLVTDGGILKTHKIPAFTLERIKPSCRAELDRRIMASAQLIKLNRETAIQKTIQRFSGWSTSIPAGGSFIDDKNPLKTEIKKPLQDLSFIERRVAIDQGHKLTGNINDIVAVEAGAIAARWNSHWRQANYDYRPDHKDLDQKIFVIKDNWALKEGLMKVDGHQYTTDIPMVGQEVYCRCYYTYLYSLRELPEDMLTEKYRQKIKEVKRVTRN